MVLLTVDTTDTCRKSYTFCFYVSGHGWGHATRANQIISDILKLPARHRVYVVSNASSFIFRDIISLGAIYRQADIDAGVVQPLAYTVDRDQTIANLRKFLKRRPATLNHEIEWLHSVGADGVVCDAPFLPCAAAAGANIPAVIASNFTFDEVYMGLCEGDALDIDIRDMVQQIISDYRHADLLVRLPGAIRIPSFEDSASLVPHTPIISSFDQLPRKGVVNGKLQLPCTSPSNVSSAHHHPVMERRIVDVPLVFRKYHRRREDVLDEMNIPPEIYTTHKILLLSFGGQALGDGSWANPLPEGWICVVCGAPDNVQLHRRFYRAAKDAYVPDLTNAADVVLGKLGYGTCSECIGHRKPFIFVSRPQFMEERGLLKLMNDQGSAVEMSRDDFEAGRWAPTIEKAAQLRGYCPDAERLVAHDGGQVASKTIENFVTEWYRSYNNIRSLDVSTYHEPAYASLCVSLDR
ncbi:uncharacterized protein BYT42DRAFT_642052 [Radiomyces spectabilis]|uniref:uncharacterized protein n=1 Tax=Radiomyces spectabilis TaxID=64574 RepID=UPI00222111F9|nr:uncharacterized protein BYT42DRAFT_642052 [Radiomyces spectabilis]KAI8391616.1 hypothetical protein BYT42DRAFT_642052 [Radiomyces spectabilis]